MCAGHGAHAFSAFGSTKTQRQAKRGHQGLMPLEDAAAMAPGLDAFGGCCCHGMHTNVWLNHLNLGDPSSIPGLPRRTMVVIANLVYEFSAHLCSTNHRSWVS